MTTQQDIDKLINDLRKMGFSSKELMEWDSSLLDISEADDQLDAEAQYRQQWIEHLKGLASAGGYYFHHASLLDV